jgi:HEAT repeat protein
MPVGPDLALAAADAGAAVAAAERLLAEGRADTLAARVLREVAGDNAWRREVVLERLGALDGGGALVGPLVEALRDAADAERRNAARSSLAALAAPAASAATGALERLGALARADADADVRLLAATALGESGNAAARPALEDALDDADPNVAAAAADALGALGVPEGLDALGRAATRGDPWRRVAAVVALGRLRDRRALPALGASLRDPLLAEAAVDALGGVGDRGALELLRPLIERTGTPIARRAERAAERILAAEPGSRSPPGWLRAALQGREAELADRLEGGDEGAAHLLGIAGTRAAAERLVGALDGPRRDAAVAALGSLPDAIAREVLVPRLTDAGDDARTALLAALPPLRDAGDVDAVIGCLALRHEPTRTAAIELLGRSDEHAVLPRVLAALERPGTRQGAVRVLGFLRPDHCTRLVELLDDSQQGIRQAAAEGLARCATPAVRASLIGALRDEPETRVRCALVDALGAAGGAEAARVLEGMLDAADPALRFTVVRALGRTRAPEAMPPLVRLLADPAPEFQAAALHALGQLGDPRAAEPVAAHLRDRDRDLRLTAAFALRELGSDRVVGFLLQALDDPAWAVRHAAVRTLGAVGAPAAAERLRELARRDPDPLVREAAAEATERLGTGQQEEDGA